VIHCPLCGCEFDETQQSCHASCALNQNCGIICCPNCGYQMTDEKKSRLASGLRRLLARMNRPQPPIRPLSTLRAGQSGKVTAIECANASRLERLNVFGLVPGVEVTLEQRHPAFVLRVGFTELSIERVIADEILVEVVS
jgi:Fe2+ transport system protein FeoA